MEKLSSNLFQQILAMSQFALDSVCQYEAKIEGIFVQQQMHEKPATGFFGMTVHWINPTTLQHSKAAISCTRLIGTDTLKSS